MTDTSAVTDEGGKPLPDVVTEEPALREDEQQEATEQQEAEADEAEEQAGAADAAADAEPDEDEEDEQAEETDDAPKKRRRPGKAARKITRLEAENQAFRERLARLEGRAEAAPAQTQQTETPAQAPRRDDFEDESDYIAALVDFKTEQKVKSTLEAERGAQTRQSLETAQAEVDRAFQGRVEDARDKYDDFDEVAFTAPISDQVAEQIRHMETGADVAYFLGQHPDEARRISGLSLFGQARELGKIEMRLEQASKPPGKKPTAAPNPPNTLKGKGGTVERSLEDASMEEYTRRRLGLPKKE